MKQPLILELKGNSLDDGPGIRSVVFFKGCPLSCFWCHNPESKRPDAELSFAASECIGCGTCLETCGRKVLSKADPFYIDRSQCDLCFDCAETCPSGALSRVGREMSTDEITNFVIRDKPFFDVSGGGVTLSGGEPTMFMEYAGELLRKLKAHGIHTLIETCGQFDFDKFERLALPYTDMIYYDIKLYDSSLHRFYCGVGNERILANFVKLVKLSKKEGFTIMPRTPLIPDITDTESNLESIATFLWQQEVKQTQLLLYNPLWYEKNLKLGLESHPSEGSKERWQSREKLTGCEKIFLAKGIAV